MPKTRKGMKGLKSQRGRGLIGQGSFGCVLRPSLPCGNSPNVNANLFKSTNSNISNKYVTKYLDQKEAEEEKKQAKILRNVIQNPDNILISPQAICTVPALSEDQKRNLLGCKAYVESPYLVQLAYGGQDLSAFECPIEDQGPFMISLMNLFYGLKTLHDNNICHLDIKPQNIVTQKLADGSYQTRFVDIGYMMDITKYAEYTKKPQLGVNYTIWPYETRYLSSSSVSQPSFFDVNAFYDKVVNVLPTYGVPNKNYYSAGFSHVLFNQKVINKIMNFCKNADGTLNVAGIAKATDVYSLGWTLCIIYTKTFKHRISRGMIEIPENDEFHIEFGNRCTRPLYMLISQMMWTDPTERLTIDGVLEKYGALLDEILDVMRIFPLS